MKNQKLAEEVVKVVEVEAGGIDGGGCNPPSLSPSSSLSIDKFLLNTFNL